MMRSQGGRPSTGCVHGKRFAASGVVVPVQVASVPAGRGVALVT